MVTTTIVFVILAVIVLWQAHAIRCYREALKCKDLSIRCWEYRLGEGPMPPEVAAKREELRDAKH